MLRRDGGLAVWFRSEPRDCERGQGWLQVKRASSTPIAAYFFAKLFSAVVFSTVIMLLLLAVGTAFGGVRLPLATAGR